MAEHGHEPSRRLGPSATTQRSFPLIGVELGETARAAMRRAAEGPDGLVNTGAVLVALEQEDTSGLWERFWIRLGRGGSGELGSTADGDINPVLPASPGACWEGRQLSPAMSAACLVLREMADRYGMRPVPPGALALALVCEPTSAAARVLITADVTAAELVEIVQEELLATDLEGFAGWVASRMRDSAGNEAGGDLVRMRALRRAENAARSAHRSPDDLDLLRCLADELSNETLAFASMIEHVPAEAVEQARTLGSRPAQEVLEAEAEAVGAVADVWQLVFSCVSPPSPACEAMLEVAGLTGPGVAADALVAREKRIGRTVRTPPKLIAIGAVKAALMLVAPTLVVLEVGSTGRWWGLILVIPVMACPPLAPATTTLVVAVASYFLLAPLNAVMGLVLAGLGVMDSRFQRRYLMARVGIGLSSSEYAGHLSRQRSSTARRVTARPRRTSRLRRWRLQQRVLAAARGTR